MIYKLVGRGPLVTEFLFRCYPQWIIQIKQIFERQGSNLSLSAARTLTTIDGSIAFDDLTVAVKLTCIQAVMVEINSPLPSIS